MLSILLYGAESWVLYRRHIRLLERFHQRCLWTILNVHMNDLVTNIEMLTNAGTTSIESMLFKIQLRWAGHVSRLAAHCLSRIVMHGELSTSHRDGVAPRERYKDSLKKSLNSCNIDYREWTRLDADREAWRRIIHQATSSFENMKRTSVEEKRRRRKE